MVINKSNLYTDYGIAAMSEENRSAVLCKAKDNNYYFVICSRGFVVSVNLHTKKIKQAYFPEKYVDYPFASFGSKNGYVYTGAGRMFMEYEPAGNEFTKRVA